MYIPKKIYLPYKDGKVIGLIKETGVPYKSGVDGNIEYTRTDAFVEMAVKWIEEINNHHHIMRYSDSCEPPLSELTEWFKNYMKGE